jgi:hypothetical protein
MVHQVSSWLAKALDEVMITFRDGATWCQANNSTAKTGALP